MTNNSPRRFPAVLLLLAILGVFASLPQQNARANGAETLSESDCYHSCYDCQKTCQDTKRACTSMAAGCCAGNGKRAPQGMSCSCQ